MRHSLLAILAIAGCASAQNAPKMKKFLTKPLMIEDQGSFFVGGVPKITYYATVAPPNAPNQVPAPNQTSALPN